jgi:pentatricopeptide repeat domain (PPR motif)
MGVLEIMKKNKVKPGLITYTNLIQACFKAKKVEYVLDVLKDLESHNLKRKISIIFF